MAKKLNLIITRETHDGSRVEIIPSDITISFLSKSYRVNTQGSVTIPLKNWDEIKYIIITDKISSDNGKDYYRLAKGSIVTRANIRRKEIIYNFKLPVFDTALYVCFYSIVKDNTKNGDGNQTIISSGIDYQIDYKADGKLKKRAGTTKSVKDLGGQTGYTHKMVLLINTSYRAYLTKNGKIISPTPMLVGETTSKALTFEVDKDLKFIHGQNTFVKEYQLQTFLQFKVVSKEGDPIPEKTKVEIQLIDYNEKVKATLTVNPDTGLTEKIKADYKRTIKVFLGGEEVSPVIESIFDADKNVTPSAFNYLQTIKVPVIKAVSVTNKPKAEAILAGKGKVPILYDLENQELIILTHKNYKEFIGKLSDADRKMAKVHLHRHQIAKALEENNISNVEAAETALATAETEAKSSINQNFSIMGDLKEIFLVENSVTRDKAEKVTLTRRYANKKDFVDVAKKALNLKDADKKITIKSLGGVDLSLKPDSLDIKALKDSIEKIKASLSKDFDIAEGSKDLDFFDFLLPSANELSETIYESKRFQVDTEAQWLRMAGSISGSVSGEVSPETRDIGLNAGFDAAGKLILCEGSITPMMALPSIKGFAMKLSFVDGIEFDAGAIRFLLSCELSGFAGAKFSIAGSADATIDKGGRQKIVAAARDPSQSISSMWNSAKDLPEFEMEASEADENAQDESNLGASINVEAFAGVEASATPQGSIQWISPESEEFESFAEMTLTGGVSAGLGGTLDLYVYYRDGKFRVRIKAALCLKVGAKGGVEFEVNAALIKEFIKWVFYQLINVGFKTLFYILPRSFRDLTQLSVLYIGEGTPLTQPLAGIANELARFRRNLEISEARYKLANRIVLNKNDDMLLCSTPEAKGILLYELSRHGNLSHIYDFPTTDVEHFDIQVHYLSTHKKAILAIFDTVTTLSEWDNVLQHMTQDGSKGVRADNEAHIIRFINHGKSLASDTTVNIVMTNIPLNIVPKNYNTGNIYLDLYLNMLAGAIEFNYPKGKKVVRHSDYDHNINRILAQNNYVSPNFYAANNPHQYENIALIESNTNYPSDRPSNDSYKV